MVRTSFGHVPSGAAAFSWLAGTDRGRGRSRRDGPGARETPRRGQADGWIGRIGGLRPVWRARVDGGLDVCARAERAGGVNGTARGRDQGWEQLVLLVPRARGGVCSCTGGLRFFEKIMQRIVELEPCRCLPSSKRNAGVLIHGRTGTFWY